MDENLHGKYLDGFVRDGEKMLCLSEYRDDVLIDETFFKVSAIVDEYGDTTPYTREKEREVFCGERPRPMKPFWIDLGTHLFFASAAVTALIIWIVQR